MSRPRSDFRIMGDRDFVAGSTPMKAYLDARGIRVGDTLTVGDDGTTYLVERIGVDGVQVTGVIVRGRTYRIKDRQGVANVRANEALRRDAYEAGFRRPV